jgi:hypothetical protein
MARQLFNSPEKQWVRQRLWLTAVKQLRTEIPGELKYLTFAGAEGHDIELFVTQKHLVLLQNVHVWEASAQAAGALRNKYGLTLRIKQGEAFDLCRSKDEKSFFPFHIINLDYTSGAFGGQAARWLPTKLETVQTVLNNQKECGTSFLLFLAFAAGDDVDTEVGRVFVHKAAFDLAKRLGRTEPLFKLTRNVPKTYAETLAGIIPCIIVRMGGEQSFDTQCLNKSIYRPYRSRKTTMLNFVFSLTYDGSPLTSSTFQNMKRIDETIEKRQHESCEIPLIDVNSRIRQK